MGSIDYGLGDDYHKRKRQRNDHLSEGDRERIENELRATHEQYEPEAAKQVRLEMLEVYERFYVNDPKGPPADIEELRELVNRGLL